VSFDIKCGQVPPSLLLALIGDSGLMSPVKALFTLIQFFVGFNLLHGIFYQSTVNIRRSLCANHFLTKALDDKIQSYWKFNLISLMVTEGSRTCIRIVIEVYVPLSIDAEPRGVRGGPDTSIIYFLLLFVKYLSTGSLIIPLSI
jgi:hypothetical protein